MGKEVGAERDDAPAPKTIGQRIRHARKASQLNQGQLAEQLGVTQPTVANWEAGVHDPRQLVMRRLAAALGVSVGWLAGGEPAETVRSAPQVPSYIRRPVQHVPVLSARAAQRVAGGIDPHQLATDYLPFAHEGGRLAAMRLPPEALADPLPGGAIVVVDFSPHAPELGRLALFCEASGPVVRPWRPGEADRPTGRVVASIVYH